MDNINFIDITRESLFILIKISTPILLLSLGIGLIISFFQALTQIQESTLTFVPKFFSILLGLLIFTPYMLDKMKLLWQHIGDYIVAINIP
jgi:flagellar biosynthetic protein FliQ